jgi:hypothetical protein
VVSGKQEYGYRLNDYSIDMRNKAHVYACRKAAGGGIRRRISRAIRIPQKRVAFLRPAAGGIRNSDMIPISMKDVYYLPLYFLRVALPPRICLSALFCSRIALT